MLCNNCHSSNAPGAKFCAVCGASLQDDYKQDYQQDPQQDLQHGYREDSEKAYSYDDGFSSNRGQMPEERHDYEYYPDDNNYGNNSGYGNNAYGNNAYGNNNGWNGGYNNNGYNDYNNNGYGGYNSGYNNNPVYGYNNYGGYGQPSTLRQNQRSVGAIIIYMISGVIGLLGMLMTVLPSFDSVKLLGKYSSYASSSSDRYNNVFDIVKKYFDGNGLTKSDSQVTAIIILVMFITPMVFQLIWAILSFCRSRGAGAIGMVGSIIYLSVASYWMLFLRNELAIGKYFISGHTSKSLSDSIKVLGVKYSDAVTIVPYLMVVFGVAGIVFSAIQIAKRDRVR